MEKQQVAVVRTHPKERARTLNTLRTLLEEGYRVVHITPLKNSIIEYVFEKEIEK